MRDDHTDSGSADIHGSNHLKRICVRIFHTEKIHDTVNFFIGLDQQFRKVIGSLPGETGSVRAFTVEIRVMAACEHLFQVLLSVQSRTVNRYQTGLYGQFRPYKLSFLFSFAIRHKTPTPDQPELTNDNQ
jgi:hypothetical protein